MTHTITPTRLSFTQRADRSTHPLAQELFRLMERKQTNLALAADVSSAGELLHLAETVGSHLCVLKTHVDIIDDFTPEFITQLQRIAKEKEFLIFEDRKFADIGNTVQLQYSGGIHRISDWSHMTNAHALPGPGIIEGLKSVGLPKGRGLLLLAQLSSKGSLIDKEYTEQTVAMAQQHRDFVFGFICQERVSDDPTMVYMTPGVQLASGGDALGQQYNTPADVIGRRGSDIAIVGRGILRASNPQVAAQEYQAACWDAYNP